MRTNKQIEASRRNGAKSKGPVTEEGKAVSSRNATTHALTTEHLVILRNEDSSEFDGFHVQCVEHFQPLCPMESDLVFEIAAARWRLRRILGIETSVMDRKMTDLEEDFEELFEKGSEQLRQAHAFQSLANNQVLTALARYETRVRQSYEKAVNDLRRMQAERRKAETPSANQSSKVIVMPVQNEPKPDPRRTASLLLQNEPKTLQTPIESSITRDVAEDQSPPANPPGS
ncbi:MAG: hypothetical protein WKF37_05365 [Bryobacteraceae bacterium]